LSSEVVEDSRIYGQEQFKNLPNTCSNPVVRSRVLKAAFHLMDQIKVPRRHGLAKDFSKKFRDALFLVDEVDKKNVEVDLKKKKSSWKEMLLKDPR
jgi:hypothetical protein